MSFDHLPYRPCAGIMLLNSERKVFVGQRIDNPGKAWQMPQGGIDEGETPQIAAIRELEEEIGVKPHHVRIRAQSSRELLYDLPPELLGKIWKGRFRGQRQHWFLADFLGDDADINIATEHPEFSAWRWIEPQQIVDLIVPFKKTLYQEILKEFAPQLV